MLAQGRLRLRQKRLQLFIFVAQRRDAHALFRAHRRRACHVQNSFRVILPQLSSRLGHLQPLGGVLDTVEDQAFYAAVGLMVLDMLLIPAPSQYSGEPNSSVFGLVDDLWKRLKKRK